MDAFKLLFQETPETFRKKKSVLNVLREDGLRLDFYVNANIDIFYIPMSHFFYSLFQRWEVGENFIFISYFQANVNTRENFQQDHYSRYPQIWHIFSDCIIGIRR